MTPDLTYLSLGAGVQSSALLVMSCRGFHGCPRADVAIFADTQGEPAWVYEHLEALREWSDIPVEVVTAGDLMRDVVDRHTGKRKRFATIPVWTKGDDGRAFPLRRQCTREYKIEPIERKVRELLGYEKGQRVKKRARGLVGISLDEATRMKPSRTPWVDLAYPLVDARLRRHDCLRIVEKAGLPKAKKSACVFCPYHSADYWRDLKDSHPKEFARAVRFDEAVRDMTRSGIERPVYLSRTLRPLRECSFDGDQRTFDWFDEECEGMCGV